MILTPGLEFSIFVSYVLLISDQNSSEANINSLFHKTFFYFTSMLRHVKLTRFPLKVLFLSIKKVLTYYTIMILDWLSVYTSVKHSLLLTLKISTCAFIFRHPVSHWNKSITLLFKLRHSVYPKPKTTLLRASSSVVNNFQL